MGNMQIQKLAKEVERKTVVGKCLAKAPGDRPYLSPASQPSYQQPVCLPH